jgi:hypothetical protein
MKFFLFFSRANDSLAIFTVLKRNTVDGLENTKGEVMGELRMV